MLLKRNDRSFRIGLTIAVIMAAMALIGYVWTPYDPTAIVGSQKFLPPSLHHLFGTDSFGRDGQDLSAALLLLPLQRL